MEDQKTNHDQHHGVRNLDELDPESEPEDNFDVTRYQQSPADGDPGCPPLMPSPQSPKTYFKRASSCTKASPDPEVVGVKALNTSHK
ncbi:hypothetical protein AVEN_242010-1 [Araneus ventricosus]|uniref:Uncharacterized protein n=1 Tax=Araneus ventricosus TaxID=182803 RepID=A0A4Y2ED24_ARAVE|nr:hypothetical protein AVEN_242010-1 [Araneus ventricosus]